QIQDEVERSLMEQGYYDVAKAYILYRDHRTKLRQSRQMICNTIQDAELEPCLVQIQSEFDDETYPLSSLAIQFAGFVKPGMDAKERLDALIKASIELISQEAPDWEKIAARFLNYSFHKQLAADLRERGIHDFYEKIVYLCDQGLYGTYILENYTPDELRYAYTLIDEGRNDLFTWSGLDLLLKRYVIRTRSHVPLETPQEMFLGIALHLAMKETVDRMQWVGRFYDMLSLLQVTMATPTLSNARKPYCQLSSCFIDTVPDSLNGIYRSIDNFAKVSKFGGGMGMYFGKVRATGSPIRGFEGAAGGVIRWIRLVNDTAVAVDQLGMRQGAAAVYLDAWHKDLPEFLQLRTNNGDDRLKAHDIFPAVCWPDLFWRLADTDLDSPWYLMCPHQILRVKGCALEDHYGEEWERLYWSCVNDERIEKRVVTVKDIVRLVLKSAVETGTPFTFMRDTVNRANPNGHAGMIYCSNLCTEIAQNMAPIETVSTEIVTEEGDTVVVNTTRPGDFVVCNLASLSLGRIPVDDDKALFDVVQTVVRALDNVIDLNFYPLPYAKITNRTYRSLGLGVSGYHHMLAKHKIAWESEKHLEFVDALFEKINYAAISASCQLAAEKGRYALFEGSDWQTGAYFDKRGYTGPAWDALKEKVSVQGMRNAYLLAIAPTSSTSIIAGTSAGVDPIMKKFFLEEKKGSMLPRVAPDLSPSTYWYYKNAHYIDQSWSVRAAGVRQRHIDQAQSVNLYITNEFTLRQVLNLYILAWKNGVKTIYYVRSKSLEVEECESCSA
ncbi:ribonucleoside-diphosphate reductase subunit alpha, partial [uncultured Dubosiella sp.]